MTLRKGAVVVPVLKERRQRLDRRRGLFSGFNGIDEPVKRRFLSRFRSKEHRALGDGEPPVIGEERVVVRELQRLFERFAQSLAVVQRSAQKQYLAGDFAPSGKARDRLVDHRPVDARRDVGFGGPLI